MKHYQRQIKKGKRDFGFTVQHGNGEPFAYGMALNRRKDADDISENMVAAMEVYQVLGFKLNPKRPGWAYSADGYEIFIPGLAPKKKRGKR